MNDQNIRGLALEAAQGSVSAFQELYKHTRQGAWFVALSITRNEHDAQDILQESYLKAYKSMDQLERPESFVAWLNQIVANKAKNYISRKKPDSFADYGNENALDWQEETDPAFLPDEHLDQTEAKALIAALVRELPEDQRLVVLLHYYDDMEVAAIAKSLEIPEGTVKSRLGRARQKLAAMLQQAQGKGLKLYSLAPIPLLAYFIKLLGFDAPGSDRLPPLLIGSAAAGSAAAGGAAAAAGSAAAGKSAAGGTAKAASLVTSKVAAIAAAAVVAVGGLTAAGVYAYNRTALADITAAQTTGTAEGYSESFAVPNLPFALPGLGGDGTENPDAPQTASEAGANAGRTQRSTDPDPTVAGATETGSQTQATAPPSTTTRAPITMPQFTTRTTRSRVTFPTRPPTTTTTTTTTTTEPPTPAKEYEYKEESDGFLTITKYMGTKTSITIPAQIDGKTVRHLGTAAFEDSSLTRVVIPPGIDCIQARTFANCHNLEEIMVPDSVEYIWPNAFNGSPKLVITCHAGTTAHSYAVANEILYTLV